jgi:membrane fusion protein (multidrug efflux system)
LSSATAPVTHGTPAEVASRPEIAAKVATAPPRRRLGAWIQRLVVLALVTAGVWYGVAEMRDRLRYVHETDARIAGELVTVSSRVAGWLTQLPVRAGDRIEPSTVLARIDARESELMLRRLQAQLDGLAAEQARLLAERELIDLQTRSRLETQLSTANAAQATLAALAPQLEYARSELRRAESLFAKRVMPRQQLDQARSEARRIASEERASRAQFEEAKARLEEARAERARLKVLDQELVILGHRQGDLRAQIANQRLDLADREIRANIRGVVDRTFVEKGEYVRPGQRLMIAHDPGETWIDANIKETEVGRLQAGQSVQVSVDAYPEERFVGTVDSIGTSTTASYALLPNPNPSGNFTKITQRLPVRIVLDTTDPRLHPGMMVEVRIDVGGH